MSLLSHPSNRLATGVLLFSASLWGLSWMPLKWFIAQGLTGPMVSLLSYGVVGLFTCVFIWRQRAAWRAQWGLLLALALSRSEQQRQRHAEHQRQQAPQPGGAAMRQAHRHQAVAAGAIVTNLRQEIDELLATGMYDEATDSVIIELKRNLAAAEQRFARMNARAGLA